MAREAETIRERFGFAVVDRLDYLLAVAKADADKDEALLTAICATEELESDARQLRIRLERARESKRGGSG